MNGNRGLAKLRRLLPALAGEDHYLFSLGDFSPIYPELGRSALKMLLKRAVGEALLEPICRGVYLYPRASYRHGFELYHVASKLRADRFNYLSLESVLSDVGAISQIPFSWITVLSSGRSNRIACGRFGAIEFIHTDRKPSSLVGRLVWDPRIRLWRATPPLALEDLRRCRRPLDLVDEGAIDDLV